jgi:magnesium transporter
LIDDIRIREFLLKPLAHTVRDLMEKTFVSLSVSDSQQDALNVFRKYDRTALPVVDSNGILVGIVTIDDMLDVAEAEATEDIQKFGGVAALDEPYMRLSLWRMVRKRAGWLVILFLGEMLTASAMAGYEDEIARAVVLAVFLPMIISSGGNSGSQASTLMIRAMALGEVHLRDWWKVMRREFQAGLVLGCFLGVIGAIRVGAWSVIGEKYFHRELYGEHWPLVSMTVGLALVGVVLWGSLSGSMLPFVLRRIGADPAASSAPFVATLVDVTGIIIYFSLALLIMRGTML